MALKHNKYRSKCFGRGACGSAAGGCDIHAAFDSPTGLIYPALDTGNLTVRTNATVFEITVDQDTGKASGVSFIDTETRKTYHAERRPVVLGGVHAGNRAADAAFEIERSIPTASAIPAIT